MHLCSSNLSVTQRREGGCVGGGGKEITKEGRKRSN